MFVRTVAPVITGVLLLFTIGLLFVVVTPLGVLGAIGCAVAFASTIRTALRARRSHRE